VEYSGNVKGKTVAQITQPIINIVSLLRNLMALSQWDADIYVTIILSYPVHVSNASSGYVSVISITQSEETPVAATLALPKFV